MKEFPSKHVVEWSKNDHTLDQNNRVGGHLDESCLTITSPTIKDKGKHTSTITNAIGSASKDTILGNVFVRLGVFPYYKVCFSMVAFKSIVLHIEKIKRIKLSEKVRRKYCKRS